MEGKNIPYMKFHFKTLYDFLYASNEFHMFRARGGLYIRARLTQHSKHIVEMVSAQKNKNTKFLPRQVTINLTGKQNQKVIRKKFGK